jgi:hypothetical protein
MAIGNIKLVSNKDSWIQASKSLSDAEKPNKAKSKKTNIYTLMIIIIISFYLFYNHSLAYF